MTAGLISSSRFSDAVVLIWGNIKVIGEALKNTGAWALLPNLMNQNLKVWDLKRPKDANAHLGHLPGLKQGAVQSVP